MKKKFAALVLALMAMAGAFFYVAPAEAIEPLCWRCVYIWFNGTFCDPTGGPAGDCNDTGPSCIPIGECSNLTFVTD